MTFNPLVSVIMPFYNQQQYLVAAVESVLAQDYGNVELVIVDDASSICDARELLAHISAGSLTILRNPSNVGSAASRNRAVLASSGDLLLPLDSDDLIERNYLSQTVPLFADPNVAGVYTDIHMFGDQELVCSPELTLVKMMAGSDCPNTFLLRRALYDELGGYKESMRFGEDREFWIRALNTSWRFKHVAKPLYRYRKHDGGKSNHYRSLRFLNQLRQNRSLYLEHLEEVLKIRENTVWAYADDYQHLHTEFHKLLANYQQLEVAFSELHAASQQPLRRQIAGKVKDLCKSKIQKILQAIQ